MEERVVSWITQGKCHTTWAWCRPSKSSWMALPLSNSRPATSVKNSRKMITWLVRALLMLDNCSMVGSNTKLSQRDRYMAWHRTACSKLSRVLLIMILPINIASMVYHSPRLASRCLIISILTRSNIQSTPL